MISHAYIHIPFCIRKCRYCDFVSGENICYKSEYLNALTEQIKKQYKKEKLKTLYIGGGTPSLLEPRDIKKIISLFNIGEKAEITLEVNPETVDFTKCKEFYDLGINRISLGVQTFNEKILNEIGRVHNEKTIYKALNDLKNADFQNISIDLIYGLPNQNLSDVKSDIKKALELDITHISTYGLKIEKNSYFGKNPPDNLPDDTMQEKMFLYICNTLAEKGFEHYEISNFAKKGFASHHNLCYWQNKNYYGFGVNASGYIGDIRYKNQSDFKKYILNPLDREEEIVLTAQQKLEEEIILALRLNNGINIEKINKKYNINFEQQYSKIINKFKKLKLLTMENNTIKLTKKGILLSNEVMCEFIS